MYAPSIRVPPPVVARAVLLALAGGVLGAAPLGAQQPASPAPPVVAPRRVPVIALVQPREGEPLPSDRPVVVLRFAAGETEDPLDMRSFSVTVDSVDRTSAFVVAAGEAWGPIEAGEDSASRVAVHPRRVTARICTVRGTCALASALVTVVTAPNGVASDSSATRTSDRRRERLIEAILTALRKVLVP